jgi:thioredoxin-like negative regulator of GroEL
MSVAAISPGELQASVKRPDLVLVECWAPSCGACKEFDPVFEEVAALHPEHQFLRLDITAEEGFSEALGIDHTPALMVYREGILLFRQPGNYQKEELADIVRQAATIDMDAVRADIAAADGESSEEDS